MSCLKTAMKEMIELLSGKGQNGGAVEMDAQDASKSSKSIKGMWKKAFKSLKVKEKTPRRESESENGGSGISGTSPLDKTDSEKPQYKRMASASYLPSAYLNVRSTPPPHAKRSISHPPPKRSHSSSSSLSNLINRTSRQSSVKKGFFRKDSKESPRDEAETPEDHGGTIDPVYSLLKCAADRSRNSVSPAQGGGAKHAHACCSRVSNQSNSDLAALSTRGNTSRSSSPSSDYFASTEESSVCSCPCHTPEVLENYHAPILAAFKHYLPKIEKT